MMRELLIAAMSAVVAAGPFVRAQLPLPQLPGQAPSRAGSTDRTDNKPIASKQAGGKSAPDQGAARQAKKDDPRRVQIQDHDDGKSRNLFTACDVDADDRLDLFETRAALRRIGDQNQGGWYRRLDHDRDGFLDWPEFDRYYRDLVRNGGILQLQLARPLAETQAVATPEALSPLRSTFELFDTDRDRSLNKGETEALLRSLGAPPTAFGLLQMFDRDHDGKFTELELGPPLQQFAPGMLPQATAESPTTAVAQSPFAALDLDGNQAISVHELEHALRRIDPQMARWAPQVLLGLDRNSDGVIRAGELPPSANGKSKGMVERSAGR